MSRTFKLSLGAQPLGGGRTAFRVWAPDRKRVEVCVETREGLAYTPLERTPEGYFVGTAAADPGTRYRYRLDGGDAFPDPCSRFQPEGPHGPSEVVDASTFRWTDRGWKGLTLKGQVLYELHVGALSEEGTYAGLKRRLPELKELGITCLELMPLNTFPGRFNWGYDGVDLFAPCAIYGRPDELRGLVDEAHRLGLGVILDVVYNHLGPDGNYLKQFAGAYFTNRYPGEWGEPINFEDAAPARRLFVENAAYWISEFHFDGLRLDATQNLFDKSECHIIRELDEVARSAAGGRDVLIIGESEPQDVQLVTARDAGGCGLDALWADDFHHSCRVAAGCLSEAYLKDYQGSPEELLACTLYNSLYQGQWYDWQQKPRGSPLTELHASKVVTFLQNHDQVANNLRGARLHRVAGESLARALTVYWLLMPQTPMLFMGQEFFSSSPFLYFADHGGVLGEQVRKGREEFLAQFPSVKDALEREGHRVPSGEDAFRRSVLNWAERDQPEHAEPLALHRELLRLRREDPVFARQDLSRIRGATLDGKVIALRHRGDPAEGDRLVLLNLGTALSRMSCSSPLVAPPPGQQWRPLVGSEEVRYGGLGATFPAAEGPWQLQGRSAVVLTSGARL